MTQNGESLLFDLHRPDDERRHNTSRRKHVDIGFDSVSHVSSPPSKGGVEDYVSPSRLSLWLRCPLAFRFRYVDGIEPPTSPSLFVGRVVHAGLESWYRHRLLGIPLDVAELCQRLDAWWDHAAGEEKVDFASVAEEAGCRRQAIDLVRTYLHEVADDEPPPLAVERAVEAPLIDPVSGENLGLPLVGVIDLVLPAPEGPVIADFKTAARGGELLETAHEIQLSSYSYLYRHATQTTESALEIRKLIKSKTARVETHRYPARTTRYYRRLFTVIRAYLDDLHAQRFVFRPGLSCASCEFRDTNCRQWDG
jgi:putative RecB family exonuclease